VDIGCLADHEEFVATLVQWHHKEWAYLRPGDTIEARTRRIRNACGHQQIPTAFVAFTGTELLGSAMLIAHDMDTRLEFSPWVAGVFVAPIHRGKGIGTALVKRTVEEASILKVPRLFLYTPGAEEFYVRLGWQSLERPRYHEVDVVVMSKEVTPNHSPNPTLGPCTPPTGQEACQPRRESSRSSNPNESVA
jgi:GNAT superfamily N-acetyltransferase